MNCNYVDNPGSASPHQLYLAEIKGDALLSAAEEKALAEAIARGDRDAESRMIRANLRLVVKIAREYIGRGLVLDDLIGEGNLGLIRAAKEYDPRFGTRFSTYAAYWIKQAIRHALINTTATIRLPAHMVGLMTKWRRVERSLTRQLGFAPSAEEIGHRLGLTETQMSLIGKAQRASHLKLECAFAEEGSLWASSESAETVSSPEEFVVAQEDLAELLRKLDRLDDRERTILTHRFGLDGQAPLTLKEVGKMLGVTREWVRKIEIRALRKLNDDPSDRDISIKESARRAQRKRARTPAVDQSMPKALVSSDPKTPGAAVAFRSRPPLAPRKLQKSRTIRTTMAIPS